MQYPPNSSGPYPPYAAAPVPGMPVHGGYGGTGQDGQDNRANRRWMQQQPQAMNNQSLQESRVGQQQGHQQHQQASPMQNGPQQLSRKQRSQLKHSRRAAAEQVQQQPLAGPPLQQFEEPVATSSRGRAPGSEQQQGEVANKQIQQQQQQHLQQEMLQELEASIKQQHQQLRLSHPPPPDDLHPQPSLPAAASSPRSYIGMKVELTGPLIYDGVPIPAHGVQLQTTIAAGSFGQVFTGAMLWDTATAAGAAALAAATTASAAAARAPPALVAVKVYFDKCPLMPGLSATTLAMFAQNECTALKLLQPHPNVVQLLGEGVLVVEGERGHGHDSSNPPSGSNGLDFGNQHSSIHGSNMGFWGTGVAATHMASSKGSSSSSSSVRLKCLILEYAQSSIAGELEQDGPFCMAKTKKVMLGVLRALAYMHKGIKGQTVMHRDIKAANLLRGNDGEVKITDFGACHIAKQQEGGRHAVSSRARTEIGSVLYRAPETYTSNHQTAGEEGTYDQTIDCFSAGVLVLEMLEGGANMLPAPPQAADPDGAKWRQILQEILGQGISTGDSRTPQIQKLSGMERMVLLQFLGSCIGTPECPRRPAKELKLRWLEGVS